MRRPRKVQPEAESAEPVIAAKPVVTVTLDRSKSYCAIFGESVGRYLQDGNEFDANGDLISK
jgi:hypothetical protein